MSGCTVVGHEAPAGYDHSGCVKVGSGGTVTASGNHLLWQGWGILPNGGVTGRSTPIKTYDFRNNWWGTTDRDSIAAVIFDMNDVMPGYLPNKAVVDYDPFAMGSVPSEDKSLGIGQGPLPGPLRGGVGVSRGQIPAVQSEFSGAPGRAESEGRQDNLL